MVPSKVDGIGRVFSEQQRVTDKHIRPFVRQLQGLGPKNFT